MRWTDSDESDWEEYLERARKAEEKFTSMLRAIDDAELKEPYQSYQRAKAAAIHKQRREAIAKLSDAA